jgi:hypothetical protein
VMAICDVCGKSSKNDRVCSNCGADIFSEEEISLLPINSSWGWGRFNVSDLDSSSRAEAIVYLRKEWMQLEEFTILRLITSQLFRFQTAAQEVRIFVREDLFLALSREFAAKFVNVSAEFENRGNFENAEDVNEFLRREYGRQQREE